MEGITIGETMTSAETPKPLPHILIDEPTIAMTFTINTSPFSGREGTYVTSRNLRDRLDKELLTNVSIRVEEAGGPDAFKVMGRGELQLAILIEMMRREGFELAVGKPEILTKNDRRQADRAAGAAGDRLPGELHRRGDGKDGHAQGQDAEDGQPRLGPRAPGVPVPSRGLIGLRSEMLTDTKGTAIMNSLFHGYIEWQGDIPSRPTGSLVADRAGKTTGYAIFNLQERGEMFVRRPPKFTKA